MDEKRLIYLLLFFNLIINAHLYPNNPSIRTVCPHLYEKTFRGYMPRGNVSAGVYDEIKDVTTLKNCVLKCCANEQCNVVFMSDDKCFHINCSSNELCIPTLSLNPELKEHFLMVLVKTTDEDTWDNILASQQLTNEHLDREVYNVLNSKRLLDIYKDLEQDESYNYELTGCEMGVDSQCLKNEICIQNEEKSRAGTCNCKDGYYRNSQGDCILLLSSSSSSSDIIDEQHNNNNIDFMVNKSIDIKRKPLNINVKNQIVKLPINEATLKVNVEPNDNNEDEKYQYEWTALQQPSGSVAVKDQNGGELHLSKLSEGLYTFKVIVLNKFNYGETYVNVSVLPPSRINKPPQIIITPANQTIKQPNTAAVLDASSSIDDDGIVSWHWELQQGPLGYEPKLKDIPTLQLNDLTKPGNYTFKLTVTDTDKAINSSTANITVIKINDYPPDANAGEDKIIYLPHNNIILNGNLSIDDHAITTWEWTKSPDDEQKAVDMQNTRTPYLKLSNLEEGMYTFVLKVTDSANQSSTAQVHVFVKPPTNKPPIANAGNNITINLPQTWVLLDGTNSSDDNNIISYKWEQIDGITKVNFFNYNNSKTNITNLTKGLYKFKLTVIDDNNNNATDYVYVNVNQNINEKPKANAGGYFEIQLPKNIIYINGSLSKDDWRIVKWKWTRNEKSIAIGNIVEKSDQTPILILTDFIIGKYIFNLTVYDEQGLSDTDIVEFIVKNDPKLYYLVEIIIDIDATKLTQQQYNNFIGKLALLVNDSSKLQIRNVDREIGTNKAKITFYVENKVNGKLYKANDVVKNLREKLRIDASLLGFSVKKLQTTICQNNCSGHGICIEETRKCECEAFWMQNMFKVYLINNDEDSDCSWSILYVVLSIIILISTFIGCMWAIIYLCYTWCTKYNIKQKPTTTTTYKLIEDTDDLPPFSTRKNLTDSDTDSDVVFESRTRNKFESRNGHKSRNGYNKIGRRIKT